MQRRTPGSSKVPEPFVEIVIEDDAYVCTLNQHTDIRHTSNPTAKVLAVGVAGSQSPDSNVEIPLSGDPRSQISTPTVEMQATNFSQNNTPYPTMEVVPNDLSNAVPGNSREKKLLVHLQRKGEKAVRQLTSEYNKLSGYFISDIFPKSVQLFSSLQSSVSQLSSKYAVGHVKSKSDSSTGKSGFFGLNEVAVTLITLIVFLYAFSSGFPSETNEVVAVGVEPAQEKVEVVKKEIELLQEKIDSIKNEEQAEAIVAASVPKKKAVVQRPTRVKVYRRTPRVRRRRYVRRAPVVSPKRRASLAVSKAKTVRRAAAPKPRKVANAPRAIPVPSSPETEYVSGSEYHKPNRMDGAIERFEEEMIRRSSNAFAQIPE